MPSPGTSETGDVQPVRTGSTDDSHGPAGAGSTQPLLDLAVFQLLEDQLDNPLIARSFASDFAKLWTLRYEVLARAVERGDAAGAMEAILSLKTSSTMVGGVRLALLAGQFEEQIRNGDLADAGSLLAAVLECGHATVLELRGSYVLRNE
ncbi:Hpt domain-containing protein [Arthrobacter silvisoli]|uniref:Hpt domain-containing protein n=1 Tax=Arthrobacter silvisoli TaxID=2291022 RepID=UPI000E2170A2|nr:Hpt domain-containing protein [Arthrobacter silvisoli]